jgi:hypothetical protein
MYQLDTGAGTYLREAEHTYLLAQKIFLRVDNKGIDFAANTSGIAMIYHRQGKLDLAEHTYLLAQKILKKQVGNNHPLIAQNLRNLAVVFAAKGLETKALQL